MSDVDDGGFGWGIALTAIPIIIGCASWGFGTAEGYGRARADFLNSPKQFARYALSAHGADTVADFAEAKQVGCIIDPPVQTDTSGTPQ